MRRYSYDIFRAEPHPDFAHPRSLPQPCLWLPTHVVLSDEYQPLSVSSRRIVAHLVERGLLPGRSQYTSVLVLERERDGTKQFLLRYEPDWGYALPTKRRDTNESYAVAGERCIREELGLTVARDVKLLSPSESVVTTRDLSRSTKVDTFYCHGVFIGTLSLGACLRSQQPLVWADAGDIVAGEISKPNPAEGTELAPAGKVSLTAQYLLQELDRIPSVSPTRVTS